MQTTKQELLDKIAQQEVQNVVEEELQGLEDDIENIKYKVDWQIGTSTVFGITGWVLAGLFLWMQAKQPKQMQYYQPPTPVEIPRTKPKRFHIWNRGQMPHVVDFPSNRLLRKTSLESFGFWAYFVVGLVKSAKVSTNPLDFVYYLLLVWLSLQKYLRTLWILCIIYC